MGVELSRAQRAGVALTDRDERILHCCLSLGAVPARTLHALISPDVTAGTFRDRLRKLHQAGYLTQQRYVAPAGGLWLYSLGRAARAPGERRPWRPGLAQLSHTLDVATLLEAVSRPGFASPLRVTGWKGEAEIRAWARPGAPFPDLVVHWQRDTDCGPGTGVWPVEVDRATESRTTWRRKLVRYLSHPSTDPVLAVTTSDTRAVHLAQVASEVGVPLLATTLTACESSLDPVVLDTRHRRRVPLSQT